MTKANGNCNRCSGKGFRDTPVVHMGIPGLCYGCDGDGTYATYEAIRKKARAAKVIDAKISVTQYKVSDTRIEFGKDPAYKATREMVSWIRKHNTSEQVFSTQDFAIAFGLTKVDAWRTLCSTTRASVDFDWDTGEPRGWFGLCL